MDQVLEDVAQEVVDTTLDPIDVLHEQMEYYRNKSITLAQLIIKVLKDNPKHQGDKLVQMYKLMSKNREMTIKVATELAPYKKPKLQSVEVKSKIEHRFVVRAPDTVPTTGDFLKLIGKEDQQPIVVSDKKNPNHKTQMQRDSEALTYTNEDIARMMTKEQETGYGTPQPSETDGYDEDEYVAPEDRID